MNKLRQVLEKALKKENTFLDAETGELNYIKIKDFADKIDEKLIAILAENKELKNKFFSKIKDVYVFNISDFKFFLDESKIDNSYTKYANKIGLSDGDELLKNRGDVVLDFPFKDCVLEGGQSTEEGIDTHFEYDFKGQCYEEVETKKGEIFFNQIIAQDEIDRLFDKKALVNWRRYSKDTKNSGIDVKDLERNEELNKLRKLPVETISENLLIDGNNLIALHSLKEHFSEKIKMIYIDPPYNTGGSTDIFTYNNNFKHSTWLTFIKNRLDIAKKLLRNDGFIAITIDHEELFYLGVLADEIFGRNNRLGIVTVYINPKGRQHEKFFSASTEYMLVYAKDIKEAKFNSVALDKDKIESFSLEDEEGKYRLEKFIRARTNTLRKNKPNFWYPIYVSKNLDEITLEKKAGYTEVLPVQNNKEFTWKVKKDTFNKRNRDSFFVAESVNGKIEIFHKYREQQVFKNIWTDKKYFPEFQGTNLLKKILGQTDFSYPKSLYAVLDALKIMTSNGDIVLDFFAGSGTTGHALLELNEEDKGKRQFILVEQLSEHADICIRRLHQVILKQKNNASFIYVQLAKWNEQAKKEINNAKNLIELIELLDNIYEKYFLNYNVRIKDFKEKIVKEEAFKNLSLEEQKRMFLTMLDLNQMYVQESEMADKKFGISKEDQILTKEFYKK